MIPFIRSDNVSFDMRVGVKGLSKKYTVTATIFIRYPLPSMFMWRREERARVSVTENTPGKQASRRKVLVLTRCLSLTSAMFRERACICGRGDHADE